MVNASLRGENVHRYKTAVVPDMLREEQNNLESAVQEELGDVEPSQRRAASTGVVVKWRIGTLELHLNNLSSPTVCFLTIVGTDRSQVIEYKDRLESRLETMSLEELLDHSRRDEHSDIGWLPMAAVASLGGEEHHVLELVKEALDSQIAQRREEAAEAALILGTEDARIALQAACEREADTRVHATMSAYLAQTQDELSVEQQMTFRLLPDLDAIEEADIIGQLGKAVDSLGEAGYALQIVPEEPSEDDPLVVDWESTSPPARLSFLGYQEPPMAFIEVDSLEARINQQITDYVEQMLPTVTYTEALERAREGRSPVAWIVMAAATAPPNPDDELLETVSELLGSDDKFDRHDAGLALAYAPWPEARELLAEHAERETHPVLVERFRDWLSRTT
jgi:hypothetical protein